VLIPWALGTQMFFFRFLWCVETYQFLFISISLPRHTLNRSLAVKGGIKCQLRLVGGRNAAHSLTALSQLETISNFKKSFSAQFHSKKKSFSLCKHFQISIAKHFFVKIVMSKGNEHNVN
jgi:hypothetical protein